MPLLSVVIPVYNEHSTILELLRPIEACPLDMEVIIIDDCSTDGNRDILRSHVGNIPHVRVLYQDHNQGEGAALAWGFKEATGEIVIVQDPDLEHDPAEYPKLVEPILRAVRTVLPIRESCHFLQTINSDSRKNAEIDAW